MNLNKVPDVHCVVAPNGEKIKVFASPFKALMYSNDIPGAGTYALQMQTMRSLKDWLIQQRIKGVPLDPELEEIY